MESSQNEMTNFIKILYAKFIVYLAGWNKNIYRFFFLYEKKTITETKN